ncbi:MAG: two pore domain potassium channel family protein [Bradyrhizobium sp.]|uniref:potassium channel family protein n=1 Tax=Bradyrhizobium sp. TaxID=376 RepID=UPI0025BC356F|nr:potassium channel family protein [Bradyrhizobium sp.]MBI5260692.1 two pore domain potassium channel family protein [Bradyrhizobium sp.]
MLRQLVFGGAVSLANIAAHAAAMALVIGTARTVAAKWTSATTVHLAAVMMATAAVLMMAHTCEIAIWSLGYALVDATPETSDRLYFAFVNFTTLGYGDIVPVPRWRLLGPMTAMNGVLLFGWSTAVIFEVLRSTLQNAKAPPP